MEILRDVLGNKSPQTVNKRANSFLALIKWLHQREQLTWPLPIEGVLEFKAKGTEEHKALSRGKALMGALRFFRHVMQFDEVEMIISDAQLVGRSKSDSMV